MANYQNILRQAHQAIADVADNADSWRAFLRSAAYTTHYAFPNQALIYSQRPGATMLADIDIWNRAAGRWVNRGAHGVASLGTGNMAGNVRYLFDIKDTHPAGKASKPLGWQITDANRYPTLQALQEKHNAESLPEIFGLQAALFVAQHGKQLDADLQNAVIGSTLEWAKPQEQTAIFANLITQSAVYMAAVRCGLGDSAVPQDAFADIDRFDTESAVLALGNAVNRVGRQMFAEIGAVVKSIDSVAKPQAKQYDVNVSKTNQQEVQDHGYDESERVSGTQDGNEGNAQTASRENRSAAGEVPAREPLPAVRQDAAGRDAVQRPETDRAALLEAGGADHHEAAGQQPGTGQEQRPVGLDGAHEQSASAGGGTGDAHRDEPVNTEPTTAESELSPSAVSVSDEIELPESVGRGDLAEETAAAIGLPSPEQQQETIRQLQPRASWQPPIKDDGTHIDEQDIVDVLVMGSGFCEGRFRIQEFFSATVLPTVKEQAYWLKKEYGIGGRTWNFRDGERGFLDYDAKGLRIKRYASDNAPDYFRLLPWNEVARRLHLLVHNNQYLDENNKQGYEKWEAEQQAKRDARQAEIDYAEKTIADFCEREGLGEPDFSNLTHIDLAYSTTGDGEHEIQVYANFLRNEIVYLVDGSFVDSARFDNTRALAKEGIEDIEFSQFIDDAEAAYEAYQERYKPKPVEKRPLAAGDTVYLENDHPFTVEEIGIFDVHLRDEDFPLIGRAVNRAEFARLLAANPKNNALAAPELPNLPDAGEAAEVVEGEVLEPAEESSGGFGEQVLQAAELIALREAYLPNNYIPPQDPASPRTPREKFSANITAIRTLKSIEKRMADGGPHANGEEQEILAQYSGWGGLSDAFEPNKDSWHSEYTELKSLLTEEEYAAARSSTLTAFYTPPEVIDAMYTALRKMGVGAGTILEPSMGVGAFFGQSHSYLYEPTTRLFGVELDSLTGRIARQLYQKANIQITGFEKADLPDSFFDVVIGNVPFGDYSVVDPQYNRLHFKIHDYFFAKSIDKLRTGGIIAFITTSGTLDKKSEEVRKYINARCDFIGAVRLPDSTFKSAGTKAMADIIFLQKRDRILEQDASWLHTTQTEDGLSLNSYFAEHPEMVCGTLKTVSGPYGPTLTCEAFADKPLADVLKEAMSHLHAEFHFQDIEQQESGAVEASIPAEPDVRNFSFCIRNGKFYYRENAIMREVSLGATSAARMRLLIELRDTTRELIQAQLEDMPDEVITELQAKLNRQYDYYHSKFGLINSRGASLDMRDDSGYFLLCSLENLDSEGNFIGKSDMFSKRTIRAARPAERVETASEALALSVGERAGIDFGYMQQLTGKDKETLIQDLQGVIFADPLEKDASGEPRYYTADEYLSGDVRHKLQVAKLAAQNNPAFAVNVQALETVQPKDLEASEIAVRLGATWLAPELIKQFADELVDAPYYVRDRVKVLYIPLTGVWNVTNKSYTGGNINAEVYEYRYVTESSFDSYMWQLLETKQKFIGQIMTSKSPARSADDLDDAALSYAEVKALAAGNPMIKEKMDLDIQVSRLKTLKTAYNNEHYRLEDAITQGFPAEMRKTAQQLGNAKADTILLQQNTKRDADGKDVFAISLMDTIYTKREDAGKALLGLLGMAMNRTEPVSIGRYKGFDLQIAYFAMDKMYLAYLVGNGINPVQLGADAVGNTMRLDNCLHNLPQSVTDLESKLVQLQKQLENAKEQLAQPFAQADELAEKSKRLAELEALLNLNEKDIVLDTVPDEDQQCRSDNRQRGQER